MGALICALAWTAALVAAAPLAERGDRPVRFDKRWIEPFFQTGLARGAADRFRVDDWDAAAVQLTRALARMRPASPERSPARFLLGLSRMNQGQWHAAGEIFEALHDDYPLLAPYHAYYAARCRLRRGDTEGALRWAARVPVRTIPEAEAVLIRLDALEAQKKWADLDLEAARFLETFPAGPRRAEATFHRALALEELKRPAEAAALYRKIWAEAPLEAWAGRATERLERIAAASPPDDASRMRTRTAAELVSRAMVYFDRNQNNDSEATFAAALAAPGLDRALECRARYHRAQSVWKQRQRPRAAPMFAEAELACRAAGDSDLVVKSLYQGARCRSNMGDKAGALAQYGKIEAEFPAHSYADDARLRSAEIATDAGDLPRAEALLREIPTRYPTADNVGESLWRLAFQAIEAQEWEKARTYLDENLRRIPREDVWYAEGRALYWKGRTYERQGSPHEAQAWYTRAVKEYPLSVYALLALERLRDSAPAVRAALVRELRAPMAAHDRKLAKPSPWAFEPRVVFGEPGFLRAVELARMGLGSDARRELARLGFAAPESRNAARKAAEGGNLPDGREEIFWITAILLDRGRLWHASHAIPRYTLTSYRLQYPAARGVAEWRLAYPRAFPELVAKNSRANGVPEALQYAIMREESTFNPRIESFANALGLTQMLVKTAQRFAPYRVTRESLLDPAKNLELGSKFLAFLLKHFGGSTPLGISGYNAGEGAVDRWLRERGHRDLDEFMESIPYDETRGYTKRVLASYMAYSWLYFPEKPVPALSFNLRGAAASERQTSGRPARRR